MFENPVFESLGLITTIIAVYGAHLNNKTNKVCFLLWMVSNILSGGLHIYMNGYGLLLRDVVFFGLAIAGYRRWSRMGKQPVGKGVKMFNMKKASELCNNFVGFMEYVVVFIFFIIVLIVFFIFIWLLTFYGMPPLT